LSDLKEKGRQKTTSPTKRSNYITQKYEVKKDYTKFENDLKQRMKKSKWKEALMNYDQENGRYKKQHLRQLSGKK
jgi:hypothetical protein